MKRKNAQTGRKRPWGPAPWQFQKPGTKKGTKWIVDDVDIRPSSFDSLNPGLITSTERARELRAVRRKVHGAEKGRPRDKFVLRCFCGAMTLRRAIARGHNCEEPSLKEGI